MLAKAGEGRRLFFLATTATLPEDRWVEDMRRALKVLALLMGLLMPGAAHAGPYEDASAAYWQGDFAQAAKWFRVAADQGHADAQNSLGTMYSGGKGVPKDYVQAAKWYRLAADQGDSYAQTSLGTMYSGGNGVPKDYVQAVKWFRLAADQGDAYALSHPLIFSPVIPRQ